MSVRSIRNSYRPVLPLISTMMIQKYTHHTSASHATVAWNDPPRQLGMVHALNDSTHGKSTASLIFSQTLKTHTCTHTRFVTTSWWYSRGGGQNCKARGRPADVVITTTLKQHHHCCSPLRTYQTTVVSDDLSCPICMAVLERPLQLACGNKICFSCCHKWMNSHESYPIPCPCCYSHKLERALPPPPMVTNLLLSLSPVARCAAGWWELTSTQSIWTASVWGTTNWRLIHHLHDVLSKPTNMPPTPAEKVAKHLVKW